MKIGQWIAALLILVSGQASANLAIFACEPEWAALAQELGGDKVHVATAITPFQDPHFIEPRPSLMAKVRNADLLICSGAELEAGWLPVLLRQAGNSRVQPGGAGYFEAASAVPMLEIPTRLDRADGDIHARGNPHIHTDPRNIALVATAFSQRMAQADPANAAVYAARRAQFLQRWETALQGWEKQAAPLKGAAVVVQHRAWPYLSRWLGLKELAAIEPKPGIEPSTTQLSALAAQLSNEKVKAIIRSNYNNPRPSDWLSERIKAPVVVLPATVGSTDAAKDLFSFYEDIVTRLLAAK